MTTKAEYEVVKIPLRLGYIAACWYGKRTERPILAVHGWQDNAGTFALLAPLLSEHTPILAIDLPGHGRSSHYPIGQVYHTLDYVRVIREIMLYFKWPKISLMGHSMGAALSYHFTSLFPESVDMIISIDVLHTRYYPLDLQIRILNSQIEKFLVDTERKIASLTNYKEPPLYKFEEMEQISHLGSGGSIDLDKTKYILERNTKASQQYSDKYYFSRDGGVKYNLEILTEAGLTVAMAKRIYDIKWLVLKGEDSYQLNLKKPTTAKVYKILQENNPDFSYHQVPGAKHHLHLNNAEKVAEYIVSFLQKYRNDGKAQCDQFEQSSKL